MQAQRRVAKIEQIAIAAPTHRLLFVANQHRDVDGQMPREARRGRQRRVAAARRRFDVDQHSLDLALHITDRQNLARALLEERERRR